jgi:hypothetical protein
MRPPFSEAAEGNCDDFYWDIVRAEEKENDEAAGSGETEGANGL